MSRFNINIAVLFLLASQSLAATQLSLTTNPSVVTDGLTDTLTLRCSLLDTNTSEAPEKSSSTGCGITQVNSIIVYRDEEEQQGCSPLYANLANRKTTIARIIGSNSPEAITVKENLQVEGVISPSVPTDPNYLELIWTEPGNRQQGQYTCEAHVLDTLGRGIVLQAKADVKVKPANAELITEMKDLKNRIDSQEKTINEMKTALKAPHAEQGEVLCSTYTDEWRLVAAEWDNQREIEKYVRFEKPYTDLPVVSGGFALEDTAGGVNARYFFRVHDISTTGFNITCGTWSNSVTYQLVVRWTSTVA